MRTEVNVNQEVAVTAWSFRTRNGFIGFPKRIEYSGETHAFENGMQYVVKKDGQVMRIFDMSDGAGTYRLKCDEKQRGWTLVTISREG